MIITDKQARFLKQLNLPVPSDRQIASRLIDFALNGNGFLALSAKQRRALIRTYWRRWINEPVQIVRIGHHFQGQVGHVEYLKARTKEEIRDLIAARAARNPLPFVTAVRLDPVSARILIEIGITSLKRVQVIQKRLFSP